MPRTVGDVPTTGGGSYPPAGKHLCRCIKAVPWISPKKKTPAALLTFATKDGEYQFEDPIFACPKALWRLVLVACRLCGMPKDTPLPDGDAEACKVVARYIVDNAAGKDALLTIEEKDETYMVTEGPEQGQKKTKKRRKVAGAGYDVASAVPAAAAPLGSLPEDVDDGSTIPF